MNSNSAANDFDPVLVDLLRQRRLQGEGVLGILKELLGRNITSLPAMLYFHRAFGAETHRFADISFQEQMPAEELEFSLESALATTKYAQNYLPGRYLNQCVDQHEQWLGSSGTAGTRLEGNKAEWRWVHLEGRDLSRADLSRKRIDGACFVDCRFRETHLADASLCKTFVSHGIFNRAVLTRVRADYVRMVDSTLSECLCDEAWFEHAFLQHLSARVTSFRKAHLFRANMQYGDYRDASFERADLRFADVRGADITGAVFHGASLFGVFLQETTGLESIQADWINIGKTEEKRIEGRAIQEWLASRKTGNRSRQS